MIELLFAITTHASELPGEELFVSPQKTNEQPIQSKELTKPRKKVTTEQIKSPPGNLPQEYLFSLHRQSTASELVMPPKGSLEIFRALKVGENLELTVNHSVIAFPDERAPVIASVQSGGLRGLKLIGESYLEKNTHRIFIEFNRAAQGDRIYNFKGVGVSSIGQPGLEGEYHSREAEYFAGDFVSSFVAGYFDGLVPRQTNAFGQIQNDSSVDSAVKKGLASGALSTADRFREKLKKVPEFSEIKGPFDLKVFILEQAKTMN